MNLTLTKTTIALFLAVATANFASAQDSSLRGDSVVSSGANEARRTTRQLIWMDNNIWMETCDRNARETCAADDEIECARHIADCAEIYRFRMGREMGIRDNDIRYYAMGIADNLYSNDDHLYSNYDRTTRQLIWMENLEMETCDENAWKTCDARDARDHNDEMKCARAIAECAEIYRFQMGRAMGIRDNDIRYAGRDHEYRDIYEGIDVNVTDPNAIDPNVKDPNVMDPSALMLENASLMRLNQRLNQRLKDAGECN